MNHVKTKPQDKQRNSGAGPEPHRVSRELKPLEDLTAYVQEYAKQRPESVAIACIGIGFVLGWKLKLW